MPAYPVKTGDFNIDLTIAVVAIPDIHKKGNGVLHMLENMPENNTVSMHLGGRCEILLNDVFIRPFVCRSKPVISNPIALSLSRKKPLPQPISISDRP